MPLHISERNPDDTRSAGMSLPTARISDVDSHMLSSKTSAALQYAAEKKFKNDGTPLPAELPRLPYPETSTLDLIELLKEIQRTVMKTDLSMATAHASQISTEIDRKNADELANKGAQEAKQAELAESSKSKNLLSWILGVVGLVASIAVGIAVCVGTFGAGVPAAIALVGAVFGAVMGASSVATQACHELKLTRTNVFGEKVEWDFSFAGLGAMDDEALVAEGITKVIGKNADANTPGAITREEFKKKQQTKATVINISLAVVGLALAIASIVSAVRVIPTLITAAAEATESAVAAASRTVAIARTVGTVVSTAASAFLAVGSSFSAGYSIDLGFKRRDLAATAILEKTIAAAIEMLQQRFDANQQNFRVAMDFQETLRLRLAEIMADYFETTITIARNTRV